ncbi:MAG: hypothetical protein ACMV1D_09220 [Macromonas sp.]
MLTLAISHVPHSQQKMRCWNGPKAVSPSGGRVVAVVEREEGIEVSGMGAIVRGLPGL